MLPATQKLVDEMLSSEQRESYAGWHFISAYLEDPYGWYLKYIRGFKPKYTKPPLIKGGAIHAAVQIAYQIQNSDQVTLAYRELIGARKSEYESIDQFNADRTDGIAMLKKWYEEWMAYDEATYNWLSIEESYVIELANGMFITVKPDRIFQQKEDGKIVFFDTKTTGWSIGKSYSQNQGIGQVDSYLLAGAQLFPNHAILGLVYDIMYKRQSVVKAERPGIVQRSERELAEFELMIIGLLIELTQKVKSLDLYPPHFLFARNGKNESYFGTEWPYIYRAPLPPQGEAPVGYTIDDWTLNTAKNTMKLFEEALYETESDKVAGSNIGAEPPVLERVPQHSPTRDRSSVRRDNLTCEPVGKR
jgi:hypothetical protein